jgi:hypothetical protein
MKVKSRPHSFAMAKPKNIVPRPEVLWKQVYIKAGMIFCAIGTLVSIGFPIQFVSGADLNKCWVKAILHTSKKYALSN